MVASLSRNTTCGNVCSEDLDRRRQISHNKPLIERMVRLDDFFVPRRLLSDKAGRGGRKVLEMEV